METRPFDPALYLDGEAAMAAYLDEAFATHDPAFVADALAVVARAAEMTGLAGKAAVSREGLLRDLDPGGNPDLKTLMHFLATLGLQLTVSAAVERQTPAEHEAETSTG